MTEELAQDVRAFIALADAMHGTLMEQMPENFREYDRRAMSLRRRGVNVEFVLTESGREKYSAPIPSTHPIRVLMENADCRGPLCFSGHRLYPRRLRMPAG